MKVPGCSLLPLVIDLPWAAVGFFQSSDMTVKILL